MTKNLTPACRLLFALTALFAPMPAWAAGTRLGLQADIAHDSNVNRSATDERADGFAEVEGYAARSLKTAPRSGLVLRAALRGREYFTYSDLSSLTFSGRVAWRLQPGASYTSPWIEVAVQGEALRFRDSPIRDGSILSASVSTGRWFSDRLRGVVGAGYERRFATEGDVYDLSIPKSWAALDWRLSDSLTLYGGGTFMGGQQVFTARSVRIPGAGWSPASFGGSFDAAVRDPIFDTANERFTAYRTDARAAVLEVGLNWAIGGQHALDLGITRQHAKAADGPSYNGSSVRAGWLYRFH